MTVLLSNGNIKLRRVSCNSSGYFTSFPVFYELGTTCLLRYPKQWTLPLKVTFLRVTFSSKFELGVWVHFRRVSRQSFTVFFQFILETSKSCLSIKILHLFSYSISLCPLIHCPEESHFYLQHLYLLPFSEHQLFNSVNQSWDSYDFFVHQVLSFRVLYLKLRFNTP